MPFKYRVLRGVHRHGGKSYLPGDTFETEGDISKANNISGVSPRLEIISSTPPVATAPATQESDQIPSVEDLVEQENARDELDSMTVSQLKNMADELEIDLEGATRKDDIVERLRVATA